MGLAKLDEPVAKVFVVGAKAENVVFAVVSDVDVPHIGFVDFQAAFFHARDAGNGVAADKRVARANKDAHDDADDGLKHNHAYK